MAKRSLAQAEIVDGQTLAERGRFLAHGTHHWRAGHEQFVAFLVRSGQSLRLLQRMVIQGHEGRIHSGHVVEVRVRDVNGVILGRPGPTPLLHQSALLCIIGAVAFRRSLLVRIVVNGRQTAAFAEAETETRSRRWSAGSLPLAVLPFPVAKWNFQLFHSTQSIQHRKDTRSSEWSAAT